MNDNIDQGVWVVRAGNGGVLAEQFQRDGQIACGFKPSGDLTGMDRDAVFSYIRSLNVRNAGNIAGQLDRFAREMKIGDLVVVPDGQTRELLWGTVTGPYEYRPTPPYEHYNQVRTVEWKGRRGRDELPNRILYSLGSRLTVFSPASADELRTYLRTGTPPLADPGTPTQFGSEETDTAFGPDEQEARNYEVIAAHVANLDAYVMQELVAGLLRGMGYRGTKVAPPGADGGVDIHACQDPLFLQPPVVKVQVKARPDTKVPAADVRQLIGVLGPDERGLFVSTGGYSATALDEGTRHPRTTLMGMEQLVGLLLQHYDELDADTHSIVPLKRLWVFDPPNDEGLAAA